jgi:hypothetical protein
MTPPHAIVYRWRYQRLEFGVRTETQLPIALRLGWFLLAKDSDVLTPNPTDAAHGEQSQD